jgi:DNA-binding protein
MDDLKMIKNSVYGGKKKDNEIFISGKRVNYEKFYYKRAFELVHDKNFKEITIYGLGACVNKAVKTALFIADSIPSLTVTNIETDTVNFVDDFVDKNTNNV